MKKKTTSPVLADTAKFLNEPLLQEEYRWEFFQDLSGQWKWLRADQDGIFQCAARRGFESYGDCIENAMYAGYLNDSMVLYIPDSTPQ